MTAILQTRQEVAIGPIHNTPLATRAFMLSGSSYVALFENQTTTDDITSNTDDLYPDVMLHMPVCGNLVNVMIACAQPGLEVYVDEMMQDTSHTGSASWLRSDQVLVTPGAPFFLRGFRFIGHRARVSCYNGNAAPVTVDIMVRVSTM